MNCDDFKGKRYLVTGATSGIGARISVQLLQAGAYVILVSRGLTEIDNELKKLIYSENSIYSANAKLLFFDLTNPDDFLKQLVIDEILFKLDGFVNAAGIPSVMPLKSISVDEINKIFQINLIAPIIITRELLKNKLINKNASLVFISSINGTTKGTKAHTIYAASKAGINGFVMSLANEISKYKIRVNSIAPGMLNTNLMEDVKKLVSSENLNQHLLEYPLGPGYPNDIASLTLFLLSLNSSWITGQTIVIDGGFSIS